MRHLIKTHRIISHVNPLLPFAIALGAVALCSFPSVLAQLALTLCVHPIIKHSDDGDASVLLAGAVAAAVGVAFGAFVSQ